MPITQAEFDAMLTDPDKFVEGDLSWSEDEDHSPAVELKAEIRSAAGYPLVLKGWLNRTTGKLSFVLLHRSAGRVYGLDLGADHHNRSCNRTGEKHKHRWTDACADRDAYVPGDIAAGVDDVVAAWQQFCAEARIVHRGTLFPPPPEQPEIQS
jgi:hypothetical protein